ncbi:flavin reductase family protein [Kerstersia gyiorum]|uniref:flavin reductase family protein n=1 Tax=Kerstersia gyiorum TaxID=206506 RepID=UPI00209CA668|nr:flavin reductase family protein [Kerstersia gyiorum]MCP1633772.1 flavin reductase (DIM6/NTAB) family NADH-FMN oxidoreductase RutF [Kerstersia gyiorum]MCP1637489.1 flavin reductase (DIM6/NTAB) family NADH-FMN oxidoreductase RutF [Kerstersia gyiorum]MCP1671637.1 flavin reductase (DIM6/NTAB) family NADH-FMN oxidoreductase RutF [Kerstersia gyiorum]MCP1679469.1 flavin reductase (DIM6/NTAB) family NADH-FMN oxidoreductase RutF [Kerstersia gyiorum]MCP1683084.1 flavin reductase (DIM6/NTAB) family NA
MQEIQLSKAFTLIEPGPVVLVTTCDGERDNIMTIAWTMVLDFVPRFALATGVWNYSYAALEAKRECVLAIPSADMLDTAIGIGTCSGSEVDKFRRFGLTPVRGRHVGAALIQECMANIECRVVDIVAAHGIVVLEGLVAYVDDKAGTRRMLHAVGDGTFIVDGKHMNRREQMLSKLPDGV